jgi:hypothetical protein
VGGEATKLFAKANAVAGVETADDWKLIAGAKEETRANTPFKTAPVNTQSASEAFEAVLDSAGATLPRRDAVDARVVQTVRQGGGAIINSQQDVGGWPEYASTHPPPDSDEDGMPDPWERKHGFDPDAPADNAQDADADGYTNIEEFLNATDPTKRD